MNQAWEKRVRSARERGLPDTRRRDLVQAALPTGLNAEDLHPNDLRTLDSMVRLATTDPDYRATLVLRGAYGSQIGEITVSGSIDEPSITMSGKVEAADDLLDLPGRQILLNRIAHCLASSSVQGTGVGVLWCDIDRFAVLNEVAGYDYGDEVLREVAKALTSALRDPDTIGRIGSDEFLIVAPEIADPEDIYSIGERLLAAARQARTRSVGGITVSIGAAFGTSAAEPSALLWQAEQAMRSARRGGGDRIEVFDSAIEASTGRRRDLTARLARAFDQQSIDVDLQPIVDIAQGGLYGLEALLRLRDNGDDESNPIELIKLADDVGMLVRVEGAVLGIACARLANSVRRFPDLRIAVNITVRQLCSAELPVIAARILEATGVRASSIDFEVSSAELTRVDSLAESAIAHLGAMGFRTVVDDFDGSPLALQAIASLGVSAVKLSPRFLSMGCDARTLSGLVELARDNGLTLTAVGVETQSQLNVLRQAGCRYAQGYLLSPPLSANELDELGILRAEPRLLAN